MSRPARTTVLVGLLLALLLAVAYGVTSHLGTSPVLPRGPEPLPPLPTVQTQTPRSDTPTPGPGYLVRQVGALRSDRSVLTNGRGSAELRYRRAAHNGTRLHFICTGCDGDTWLVGLPRGNSVGGGPLTDPADVIWTLDDVAARTTSSLLVKAPASALWTVALTPFDAVPVHEQTFGSLGVDVVAVRAPSDVRLTCGSPSLVRTLVRPAGAEEYDVGTLEQQDDPGTFPVTAPRGTGLMIMTVSCRGRWTVTFP